MCWCARDRVQPPPRRRFHDANNAHGIGFSLEIGPTARSTSSLARRATSRSATLQGHRPCLPESRRSSRWPRLARPLHRSPPADRRTARRAAEQAATTALRSRARVILQGRAAANKLAPRHPRSFATPFTTTANGGLRLRAMWGTHVTGGWTIRAQCWRSRWRIATNTSAPGHSAPDRDRHTDGGGARPLQRLAREDASPVVRLHCPQPHAGSTRPGAGRRGRADVARRGRGRRKHSEADLLAVEPLVKTSPPWPWRASRSHVPLVARFHRAPRGRRRCHRTGDRRTGGHAEDADQPARRPRDGLEGRFDLVAPQN